MQTPNFVVDGYEFPDNESCLAGDGQHPPFMVFDIAAQDYMTGKYDTRKEAQAEADRLNEGEQSGLSFGKMMS